MCFSIFFLIFEQSITCKIGKRFIQKIFSTKMMQSALKFPQQGYEDFLNFQVLVDDIFQKIKNLIDKNEENICFRNQMFSFFSQSTPSSVSQTNVFFILVDEIFDFLKNIIDKELEIQKIFTSLLSKFKLLFASSLLRRFFEKIDFRFYM